MQQIGQQKQMTMAEPKSENMMMGTVSESGFWNMIN
jgi:hypothetical protein